MTSSNFNKNIPLFIFLGLAAIFGAIYLMHRLLVWRYWKSRGSANQQRTSQADEEKGRTNSRRRSRVSLDSLTRSRSSSTAAMVPNAIPPAHIPRARQVVCPTAAPARPLRHLPSLDDGYSPAAFPRQQSLPDVLLFVIADDSTETPEIRGSSLQPSIPHNRAHFAKDSKESLETVPSPLEQSSSQTRLPFANDSPESVGPEAAEFLSPVSTSTYFPAPETTTTHTDILPLRKPVSLSLEAHTRTGTVQAQKPRLVCLANRESDTAAGTLSPTRSSLWRISNLKTSHQGPSNAIKVSHNPTLF